ITLRLALGLFLLVRVAQVRHGWVFVNAIDLENKLAVFLLVQALQAVIEVIEGFQDRLECHAATSVIDWLCPSGNKKPATGAGSVWSGVEVIWALARLKSRPLL